MKINIDLRTQLNKDPKDWAKVSVDAVLAGSQAQVRNVLQMALQDIQRLAQEREVLTTAYVDAQARKGDNDREEIEV